VRTPLSGIAGRPACQRLKRLATRLSRKARAGTVAGRDLGLQKKVENWGISNLKLGEVQHWGTLPYVTYLILSVDEADFSSESACESVAVI
jgi:hypothetical protein